MEEDDQKGDPPQGQERHADHQQMPKAHERHDRAYEYEKEQKVMEAPRR